ncbi:MAG: flagellar hook-associated protein FlgK [Clostridia bacterium]
MSMFNSLNIAKSGLFASQKAIELTGHNIANANTEGYTRQRLEMSSKPSLSFQGSSPGGGVSLDDITQVRDKYIDVQLRKENSVAKELEYKASGFEFIEGIIAEPTDYGINAAMSDLFNSMEELSYNAEDLTLREIVVQNAVKLTDTFKSVSNGLVDYQRDLNSDLTMVVEEINSIGEQIQNYNQTIRDYENRGKQANDLRDKRNLLVDQLSDIVPVDAKEDSDGRFSVKVGGVYLVDQYKFNPMEVKLGESDNPYTSQPDNEVFWSDSEKEVSVRSGRLKGLLDLRDGNTEDNQGVAYYIQKLDNLAQAITEKFNEEHVKGYTLPTDGSESQDGIEFFKSYDSDSTKEVTARNMSVSDALISTGFNIAASDSKITGDMNWGNNGNLVELVKLRDKDSLSIDDRDGNEIQIGNLEQYLRSTVSDLAITTDYYNNRSESQKTLTDHIENQKMSISEVSTDEEMMNLVQYQHSYSAAAKLVTVVDEMLMTLINMR